MAFERAIFAELSLFLSVLVLTFFLYLLTLVDLMMLSIVLLELILTQNQGFRLSFQSYFFSENKRINLF